MAVIALVMAGFLGLRMSDSGSAAQFSAAAEAEAGEPAGAAVSQDVAGSSGGSAVRFAAGVTPGPAPGAILFEDDFDGAAGASFDKTKWHDYSACGYHPSAAYGSIKCGDNETLDGQGHLIIPATPTSGSSIMTGEKFKFQYGTMSAWLKLPPQPGYWPAFWTVNNVTTGGDTLPVGEIDVIEGYTTWLNVYHATGHTWTGNGATDYHAGGNRCPAGENADLTQWHKYSARVEPNKITYYFDDVQCGRTYEKTAGKVWGFGPDVARGNWLILTLAVGGADGQQIPASQPAQMLVDRVEVRSL